MDAGIIKSITGAYNFVYVGAEVVIFILCAWLYLTIKDHSDDAKQVLIAWIEVSGSLIIRLGYWLVAIAFADESRPYAQWANEHKWLIIFASVFTADGVSRYAAVMLEWSKHKRRTAAVTLWLVLSTFGWVAT